MSGATAARRGSRRRRWFALALVVASSLALEGGLRLALARLARRHNLYVLPRLPSAAAIEHFAQEYYHPRWGFDLARARRGPLGARPGSRVTGGEPVAAITFGDSFTYGDGVHDHETWQSLLEERGHGAWLNYGVPAYGVDQALLKYEDTTLRARYAVLGVLDENIARGITVWWPFYMPRSDFPGTKPRFEMRGAECVLVANPLGSVSEVGRLGTSALFEELRGHDGWLAWHRSTGAPDSPSPLATWTVLRHAGYFARSTLALARGLLRPSATSLEWPHRFYRLYAREGGDTEALRVLEHAVSRFVAIAHARGEEPVVLLFPVRRSVEIQRRFGVKPYQPLAAHVRALGVASIDFGDVFAAAADADAFYLGGDGHFSPAGNACIAREIERRLLARTPPD